MKRVLFYIGILLFSSMACKHQMVAPGTSAAPVPVTGNVSTNDTVCFFSEVLPLFQSYCGSSGCHDAATAKEDVVLTDYFNIMKGIRANNPASSEYYTILSESMPPRNSPQLTVNQKATILKWINQGALNTVCISTTCDSTKTTYNNGMTALFSTYCNGCHGVSPGSGNVVLGDYINAKNAGTSLKQNFLNAINYTATTSAKNMPPGNKLSSCQINQITTWINNGCPQ